METFRVLCQLQSLVIDATRKNLSDSEIARRIDNMDSLGYFVRNDLKAEVLEHGISYINDFIDKNFAECFQPKRVAMFDVVSREQFIESFGKDLQGTPEEAYLNIRLPERATIGSAGYDFVSPVGFCLHPGESILIPTGIRCRLATNWVLKIYPRSGLGFKYRVQLNNTVGIIDSDYYYSDNEGHIKVKITNDSKDVKDLVISAGDKFCQGIFVEYGITVDDSCSGIRNGGFGSTL